MKLSKADQESYVMQGLALGLLAAGAEELPADKLRFEFAFGHALRGFAHKSAFPRIGAATSIDPYYLLSRSSRRRGPLLASWDTSGRALRPFVGNEGWSVSESGEMLAEWSGVPWPAWQRLAAAFLDDLHGEAGEDSVDDAVGDDVET